MSRCLWISAQTCPSSHSAIWTLRVVWATHSLLLVPFTFTSRDTVRRRRVESQNISKDVTTWRGSLWRRGGGGRCTHSCDSGGGGGKGTTWSCGFRGVPCYFLKLPNTKCAFHFCFWDVQFDFMERWNRGAPFRSIKTAIWKDATPSPLPVIALYKVVIPPEVMKTL